jgi:adenosylmethionine-8-amino-7-oxononanoate aminotransferase
LACAAANASMKLLMKKKVQQAIEMISQKHRKFVETVEINDKIADARCQGTIMAIELTSGDPGYTSSIKERIYDHFMERDILLRPLGNVIYMIPPFVITEAELDLVHKEISLFLKTL